MNKPKRFSKMFEKGALTYEKHPIARTVVQAFGPYVPIVPMLDAGFQAAATRLREERERAFYEEFRKQGTITEEVLKDKDFVHATLCTLAAVHRTRQEEKIHLFAHLLSTYASGDMPAAADDFEETSSILEDLSIHEIRILRALHRYEAHRRYLFGKGSIRLLDQFFEVLADRSNPLSRCLVERFSETLQQFVTKDRAAFHTLEQAEDALIHDLNYILVNGQPLYDAATFANVTLRAETQELLEQHPRFEKLLMLKRLLLEDAYPDIIAPHQYGRPMITPALNNPFIVHQTFWPGFEWAASAEVGQIAQLPGVLRRLERTGLYRIFHGIGTTGDVGYLTPNFAKFVQTLGLDLDVSAQEENADFRDVDIL